MRRRWWPVMLPALLGAGLSLLIFELELPNPRVTWSAQVSWYVGAAGILITLVLLLAMLAWEGGERAARTHIWRQAARERRRFLRRLDHELKNPLTAIMAGLANVASVADRDSRPALESVGAQVQRLRRLVADLRKLSDLETRELERIPIDLSELLQEVFALAEEHPGARTRQLKLVIPQAPWPLPTIPGDRDLLFLAFYNPLDNALKFTAENDTIELRAAEADGGVVVEIADTGPGIPAAEIDQVWDELYRGEGARGVAGSGLGLALVRAIISRHGGQVSIRSRPRQGTLVTLSLPAGDR